jgi:DNA invertase Pin-like site-specific DNA recombinase
MKKTYGYARVSTKEQHLDRQLKSLLDCGVAERDIITDKASGASLERNGYLALKNTMLRDGDTLIIKSLDRLSRNKEHIKQELEYFKSRHIRVRVIDLPTTMLELPNGQEWVFEMINNILIEVLASIAEQERLTIRQRQAEGIAAAKEKGKHMGRPATCYPPNWSEIYQQWKAGELTAVAAMKKLGLKRGTFYKLANAYREESQ